MGNYGGRHGLTCIEGKVFRNRGLSSTVRNLQLGRPATIADVDFSRRFELFALIRSDT